MVTFLVLVVLNRFQLLKTELADEAWLLPQSCLGGYVAGRSFEKITGQVINRKGKEDDVTKG